jgi:hypothetical protein
MKGKYTKTLKNVNLFELSRLNTGVRAAAVDAGAARNTALAPKHD